MRSVIQHLRFPFSLFLMPVYWFALSESSHIQINKAIWVFLILHFLIYPASNAYNSYFDKDDGPIGGIAKPLPVNIELYYIANGFDFLAIIIGYFTCGWEFALAILIYALVSKAYSHPKVRLKKYPYLSWLIVGFFQGFFVYWLVFKTVNQINFFSDFNEILFPALLSSINLWAFYPITQIYQHEADSARGDITMSIKLGISGTFVFTAILFLISTLGFYLFLNKGDEVVSNSFIRYLIIMAPPLVFFNWWALKAWQNKEVANFKNTMLMNILGALCLNVFFILQLFKK